MTDKEDKMIKCIKLLAKVIETDQSFQTARYNYLDGVIGLHWGYYRNDKPNKNPNYLDDLHKHIQETISVRRGFEWKLRSALRGLDEAKR